MFSSMIYYNLVLFFKFSLPELKLWKDVPHITDVSYTLGYNSKENSHK